MSRYSAAFLILMISILTVDPVNSALPGERDSRNEIYRRAKHSLVKIYKTAEHGSRRSVSCASGFIYDRDGSIVTNYHAIRNASQLEVAHLSSRILYENINIVSSLPIVF